MSESDSLPGARPWLRAAAVLAVWTVVGLVSALQTHVLGVMEGRDVSVLRTLAQAIPPWWYWALATPAVAWLVRRAPLEHGVARAAAIHTGGALLAALGHTAWLGIVFHVMGFTASMTETVSEYLRLVFVSRLYLDLLTYGAIVGVVYALDYRHRFQERELRASRLEAQLARARLDVLRMQLNPHFLFNALNAVAAQVRAGRGDAAVSMVGGLGDLLRYALEAGAEPLVPLKRERAFLERYVEIEAVRFSDRLTVTVDLPDGLDEVQVPPLLLQPLVENAVRHGIAPREGPGHVEVRARRHDGGLRLTVLDDGVGLAAAAARGGGTGVGLANTRARLHELYGASHRFVVEERAQGGTLVTVDLPLEVPA